MRDCLGKCLRILPKQKKRRNEKSQPTHLAAAAPPRPKCATSGGRPNSMWCFGWTWVEGVLSKKKSRMLFQHDVQVYIIWYTLNIDHHNPKNVQKMSLWVLNIRLNYTRTKHSKKIPRDDLENWIRLFPPGVLPHSDRWGMKFHPPLPGGSGSGTRLKHPTKSHPLDVKSVKKQTCVQSSFKNPFDCLFCSTSLQYHTLKFCSYWDLKDRLLRKCTYAK